MIKHLTTKWVVALWSIALVSVTVLAGCGGGGGGDADQDTTFNAPPAPEAGSSPQELFSVITDNYYNLYTSQTAPFSPEAQFADQHYPFTMAYEARVSEPSGFQLSTASEAVVQTWAQADPRVCAVSGVPLGQQLVHVILVESIEYGGMNNIIGLAKWLSGPRFEVYVVTKDPISGGPMSNMEISKVLAHEFGHVLGLGHSPDERDLMYYRDNSQQGDTWQSFLTYGDAIALWSTLNNRKINWVPERETISYPVSPQVIEGSRGRHARVTEDDGRVIDVYNRPAPR